MQEWAIPQDNRMVHQIWSVKTTEKQIASTFNLCLNRPVAKGGGQGGQLTPPLRTKGPFFGTSRVKLLRPITING